MTQKKHLHIITRCVKPDDLLKIKESIDLDNTSIDLSWHIIFDTNRLKDIDAELLSQLNHDQIKLYFYQDGNSYNAINRVTSIIKNNAKSTEEYAYLLHGDSTLHSDLLTEFVEQSNGIIAFVFAQTFGKNQEGIRHPFQQNIRPGHIDGSQYIFNIITLVASHSFEDTFDGDGRFIQSVIKAFPDNWKMLDKVLHQYANLKPDKKARIPRVLYIGEGQPVLRSANDVSWESHELDVKYKENDADLSNVLIDWNPDVIISCTEDKEAIKNLEVSPIQFKSKWIKISQWPESTNVGELVYQHAMNVILNRKLSTELNVISYFTPIYNTGNKLLNTYQSLMTQLDPNWEWVMVNDSTDGGYTYKIAEQIAKFDPRVKLYDFREKSNGLIGEVKWRAACMCTGEILAELDHDDILTPDCTTHLRKASTKYPSAGFFYSDAPEVDDITMESKMYEPGFALGYGAYRTDNVFGKEFQSSITPNVNPKTIRHIVGVPNHIRAWRRSAYFNAGGHARNLAIADDYELIVRTFLTTTMVHIPKTLYIQKLYNDGYEMNTQDLSRADIQRRVKTIAEFYKDAIKDRFEELGIEDWAYQDTIYAESLYGIREGKANLTYED
jgi:glycosyltransferase involved in cell wall biosynthesis